MIAWLRRYGVQIALAVVGIGLVSYGVIKMSIPPRRGSMPVRENPELGEVVEKEFTATPDAEVTVETGVPITEKGSE